MVIKLRIEAHQLFNPSKMYDLHQKIVNLETRIAGTERRLADYQREWNSLLVCFNEDSGVPYSAYCDDEELEELEENITWCQRSLHSDRQELMVLQNEFDTALEEMKRADEGERAKEVK
jgi:hypothetical protein